MCSSLTIFHTLSLSRLDLIDNVWPFFVCKCYSYLDIQKNLFNSSLQKIPLIKEESTMITCKNYTLLHKQKFSFNWIHHGVVLSREFNIYIINPLIFNYFCNFDWISYTVILRGMYRMASITAFKRTNL